MFRAVLQKNTKVLKGLIGALLHLDPESIEVEITNPIILGKSFENKDMILDINVIINGQTRLNLEMQIVNYHNCDSWVHGIRKVVPPYYTKNNYSST